MRAMRSVALAVLSLFAAVMLPAQQATPRADRPIGLILTKTAAESNAVLAELKRGMNFAVLAKEHSMDPSAQDGGYLKGAEMNRLGASLLDVEKGLQPGQYSGAMATASGFAIVTVFRKAPATKDLGAPRVPAGKVARQSINVAGLSEADALFDQYPKKDRWNYDLQEPCEIRKESHAAAVTRIQSALTAAEENLENAPAPIEMLREYVTLAQLHAFSGDMDHSIQEWSEAYRIAQASVPGAVPYLEEALGVSYFHRAGIENGVMRDSGTMDIFPPLNPTAHYAKTEDSQKAIQYFLGFLKVAPGDLQVRWLLSLAYMTLGEYPAGVPAIYVIPLSAFESKENIGRFTDVGRQIGLNAYAAAGGMVVDDFENNGLLDVVISSKDFCDSMHYFHNNGDGTFTDRTAAAGLSNQLGALNLIQADYNNDGCMDLLVLRGGWEFPMRKSLLRNNCNGTFTDVTQQAGLADGPLAATQTAAWADIDNDGLLDLFVGNENAPSQLFRNKGDGTFEDISHAAGIDKVAYTKGVVAADFDKDGYPDFYLSNYAGPNFLYHNNHDGTFTDVARQAGVQGPFLSFATWFFDYDNDGWPDLFVTSYYSYTVDQVMRSYLGMPVSVETMKLYRNLHDGTFADVTSQVGLDRVFMPMGANFGDVDNDGFLDIYLGMGQPAFADVMPHVLLRNDGGKSFVDITASSGTGEIHKGHGIAFADLNRSGHEDILAEIGGAVPGDKHAMRVFRNWSGDNDWINLRLVGVKTNREAMGAEITLTVTDDGGAPRTIFRTVGDSSSFGANPMEQHIGLGHHAEIRSVDVFWPTSKTHQHFANVAVDQYLEIKEFAESCTKLDRPFIRLSPHEGVAGR
ncbi:MAG: FG-GAP-like repeat-containing protein [Acidobacteriaceae bacterium]